jgi:holo-[acyl-carrier protein] synthase
MILGIGVDIIDIHRFAEWHIKPQTELLRVFSQEEITYCLHENKQCSAERFAVRFAAKEAFFKAYHAMFSSLGQEPTQSLLTIQKHVSVSRLLNGAPMLNVNWKALLPEDIAPPSVHVSLSHAQSQAVAMVILEKRGAAKSDSHYDFERY